MTPTYAQRICTAAALLAATLIGGTTALADNIWTKSGTAAPYKQPDVKILKVEDGKLVYKVLASDRQADRPLEEVWQIKLDNDPLFSAAEQAFASEQWDQAATNYQKVLDASKIDWQRQRATVRLIDAAGKSGNFGQMARGYAELVKADPTQATKHKPAIPTDKAGSLGGAIAEVDKVLNGSGVNADQKAALTAFKIDLLNANGEREKAGALVNAALNTPTGVGATGTSAGSADSAGKTDLLMTAAATAAGAKDYAKVVQLVNEAQDRITDPAQQVEAFYLRGDAKAGMAKDATGNKEAALDLMRCVARAKAANIKSPRVSEALMKTAQILEKLDAKPEAIALYQQVADEFKGDGAAAEQANASIARLGGAAKGSEK